MSWPARQANSRSRWKFTTRGSLLEPARQQIMELNCIRAAVTKIGRSKIMVPFSRETEETMKKEAIPWAKNILISWLIASNRKWEEEKTYKISETKNDQCIFELVKRETVGESIERNHFEHFWLQTVTCRGDLVWLRFSGFRESCNKILVEDRLETLKRASGWESDRKSGKTHYIDLQAMCKLLASWRLSKGLIRWPTRRREMR